jgi:hypothetical protein
VKLKNWSHPADIVKMIEIRENKENTIQLYTDSSKSERGVGSGVMIFVGNELAAQLKFKQDKKFHQSRGATCHCQSDTHTHTHTLSRTLAHTRTHTHNYQRPNIQ